MVGRPNALAGMQLGERHQGGEGQANANGPVLGDAAQHRARTSALILDDSGKLPTRLRLGIDLFKGLGKNPQIGKLLTHMGDLG